MRLFERRKRRLLLILVLAVMCFILSRIYSPRVTRQDDTDVVARGDDAYVIKGAAKEDETDVTIRGDDTNAMKGATKEDETDVRVHGNDAYVMKGAAKEDETDVADRGNDAYVMKGAANEDETDVTARGNDSYVTKGVAKEDHTDVIMNRAQKPEALTHVRNTSQMVDNGASDKKNINFVDDNNRLNQNGKAKSNELYSNKTRPDLCKGCFTTRFMFTGGENICSAGGVDLVILITTAHSHGKARSILRRTWLNDVRRTGSNVKYAFFLGETSDQRIASLTYTESKRHGDMVFADFKDAYNNLTYKTIAMFTWVKTRCPQAKYVMKTDDDMYINVSNMLDLTRTHVVALENHVVGACKRHVAVRNERSKYYASSHSYPHRLYPPLCSGTGYVTSSHVVGQILEVSPNIPFFHLEDVYVGLCLEKLGLKTLRHQGFTAMVSRKFDFCELKRNRLITGHLINPVLIYRVWKMKC